MRFRLVPKSVLNDLERRNGLILSYFTEFVYDRKTTTSISKSTFDSLRPY